MKRYKNEERAITKIWFFLFLSVIIHFILLLFPYEKKGISLGENLIPIEILEIEKLSSNGEYLKEYKNKSLNEVKRNVNEEEIIETKDANNLLMHENTENIIKLSKKKVEKKKITNPENSELNKNIGNKGNINKNKIEKGSLKGIGLEKISCISSCRPKYPKEALRRGFQGLLILKLFIDRSGDVINVKVIKSTGYKILDKAGIESAKNSKYLPLQKERSITTKDIFKLNN